MNWFETIIATLGVLSAALFLLLVGWHKGRQYGRDEQWVEDVLAQGRRDAERRDARGRFRSLSGKN